MKGLSFSEPMVKAWMDGRKTVTRRLMNPQPDMDSQGGVYYRKSKNHWAHYGCLDHFRNHVADQFSFYLPGETVYIKEAWWKPPFITDRLLREGADTWPEIVYDADCDEIDREQWKEWEWSKKAPRFMPEWASRSHALIVSVRPERVQDITEDEAEREGLKLLQGGILSAFAILWEYLHPGS